jgi:hypothetical protein
MYKALMTILDVEDLSASVAIDGDAPDAPWKGQRAAADYNRVAQTAANKGCDATARRIYLKVVDRYVGPDYAAMRQRAQIGLDDLRAALSRDTPPDQEPR